MKRPCILVADNLEEYVGQVRQYLERHGYSTSGTSTAEETRAVFRKDPVDLALIDVRMVEEGDKNDRSGLEIASNCAPEVPKIILTAYQPSGWVSMSR